MVGSASPLGGSLAGHGRAGPESAAPKGTIAARGPIPPTRPISRRITTTVGTIPLAGMGSGATLGAGLATGLGMGVGAGSGASLGAGLGAGLAGILALAGGAATSGVSALLSAALFLTGAGLLLGAAVARVRRRMRALERARAEAEARARLAERARARAEAESRAKSRFLAEMSHELRTPLNTVMGFSEMMAEEMLGPHKVPAYADYARDIHASGRHLLALADDLLDLARIESGHRILLETSVRLDLIGEDCLAMMRQEAHAREVTLALESRPVRIWGDERALRQMTLNLLSNAVKFTPRGGEVLLTTGIETATSGKDAPYLAVADTGPGISAQELPLGQGHHRESRLDVTTGRGAGLGLAIVRGLVQLHEGSFCLVRRPGGGTLARIDLPSSRLMPLSEPPARRHPPAQGVS